MMNERVTNKGFKYLKRLFLECLKENSDIEKQLDSYYKRIQVYFARAVISIVLVFRRYIKS